MTGRTGKSRKQKLKQRKRAALGAQSAGDGPANMQAREGSLEAASGSRQQARQSPLQDTAAARVGGAEEGRQKELQQRQEVGAEEAGAPAAAPG